jgi:hypothetical protein
MTLRSIFEGEGFEKCPGQFIQIARMWIYHNRSRELMAFFESLEGQSASTQAEMLVEWIDNNTTTPQRDNCIQCIMDGIC